MLNYAFVNTNDRLAYISDETFAFHGTWTPTGTFSPPIDVVDYDNGKWISLAQTIGVPPLNSDSWSQLVLVGTVNPTDPFNIANTALQTAETALALAESGTSAGTNVAIASGTNFVYISGLGLSFTPSAVPCSVRVPDVNGATLTAVLVGNPTTDGFVVKLSGTTDGSGYRLDFVAHK